VPESGRSREHAIVQGSGGMISVVGGKLTTYRSMAKEVVDRAVRELRLREGRRRTTEADTDEEPLPGGADRSAIYRDEVRIGAELIGWKDRKPRGQNGKGPIKRGLGMALHQWGGGGAQDKQVTCTISPDGSVEVKSATQDIGTGARTILAIIAAELLGLNVADIRSNIGNSTFPPGQASGGSTTTPSMSPPCFAAVSQARDALFAKIAPGLKAKPEELSLKDGKVLVNGEAKMDWKDACRKLGMMPISETGKFEKGLSSVGVAGCQFADVTVDVETGVVRVKKIVAIQDSGLIIDLLTWESQVYGGIIMGLGFAMFENRILDRNTGLMVNPNMEFYLVPGMSDVPQIDITLVDQPERGVVGIGEPPVVSTAAAIGNAIANAIGVRVRSLPLTPDRILAALEQEKAGGTL
jgi:xanthine dehydrogenase YagR molybdenum-binding subunit